MTKKTIIADSAPSLTTNSKVDEGTPWMQNLPNMLGGYVTVMYGCNPVQADSTRMAMTMPDHAWYDPNQPTGNITYGTPKPDPKEFVMAIIENLWGLIPLLEGVLKQKVTRLAKQFMIITTDMVCEDKESQEK